LELWNTDTKLGHTFYVDMVARLHPFLISANVPQLYEGREFENENLI